MGRRLLVALLLLGTSGCAPRLSDACREALEAQARASAAWTDFPAPIDDRAKGALERATRQVLEHCRPVL